MFWFIILFLVIVIILLKIIFTFLQHYPGSDIQKYNEEIDFPLPIFVMPEKDVEKGNGFEALFINKNWKKEIDFHVILKDEDHPLADSIYDVFRRFLLGRIKDVEKFTYKYNGKGYSNPESIKFLYIYSGSKDFRKLAHKNKNIPYESFKTENNRPIIYINTWNHAFGEKDNNPELKKIFIKDYPIYSGNRIKAEQFACKK